MLPFQNLAGVPQQEATPVVEAELYCAGLTVCDVGFDRGEVQTSVQGRFAEDNVFFKFTRAWRYWICEGPVELEVATRLYERSTRRAAIRVAGHAAAPAPADPWLTYRTDSGNKIYILTEAEQKLFDEIAAGAKGGIHDIMARWLDHEKPVLVKTPELRSEAATYVSVDLYHIDTLDGLVEFVRHIERFV